MARRRTGPPLYDLITSRSKDSEPTIKRSAREARQAQPKPPKQPKPHRRDSNDDAGDNKLFDWIHPGRKVAFPVGYVLVASAGVIAIVLMTYMFAYGLGNKDARTQLDQELLDSSNSAEIGRNTTDPLLAMRSGTLNDPASNQNRGNASQPNRSVSNPQNRTPTPRNASSAGPIQSDPRVEGKYYYIIATTRRDGAIRLAEFCRERGLEAYVIGGHNDRLSQVIALPGLDTSSSSNPTVSAMREQILRIGRLWEKSEPGATNLSDAYVARHK